MMICVIVMLLPFFALRPKIEKTFLNIFCRKEMDQTLPWQRKRSLILSRSLLLLDLPLGG